MYEIPKVQKVILTALRKNDMQRYTDLQKASGLESDQFKFHLRNAVKAKLVYKNDNSRYELTAGGKEFANNLADDSSSSLRQAKLSVLVVITTRTDDRTLYLVQERTRHPYWGYSGYISGPVKWGESFTDAGVRELSKQTGLTTNLSVAGFLRKLDTLSGHDTILEDKVFVVLHSQLDSPLELENWSGGKNEWVELEQLKSKKCFNSEHLIANLIGKQIFYESIFSEYPQEDY